MQDDELIEFAQFPDLLGAVMRMGEELTEQDNQLDADGTFERPLLPLRGMVLFPQMVTPLFVGRDRSLAALQAANANGETIIVAAQKDSELTSPDADDLYTVGTEMSIGKTIKLPDNSNSVLCQGRQRVEIVEFTQLEPYIRVKVRPIFKADTWDQNTEALMRAVLDLFEKVVELNRRIPEDAFTFAINAEQPSWLADFIASTLDISLPLKQNLLETLEPIERLEAISVILGREVDVLETENKIHSRVQQEIDKSQREHFLREQLRAIQGELGEDDIFTKETTELRTALAAKVLPDAVRAKADKEMARLGAMPPMSPEMGIIRTYLDWLVALPWDHKTEDNLDVRHAAEVLDEDHYGLTRVKDRILEYIAVRQIASDKMRTPILCFVGPPGTGKTSIGKSIAKAMNREFVRMSLGGMRDEAEIRGHRRTYIGAMPGRIIQSIRRAGSKNPLFMLDEIDKIGKDFRGDPASALLEVLDPEQNDTFRDLYLDVDFDLTNVLFLTTANALSEIPHALRDRMEVIEFSGYLDEEKMAICRQFIIPRQLEEHGLLDAGIAFDDPALKMLIRQYTYEAGVRNLEREMASVCRKIARKLAEGRKYPRRVNVKQLEALLGPPRFLEDKLREDDEIGVATGVAWTSTGGDTMPIEVNLMSGKGNLLLTGKLGDVMKESARAALTYTRSQAEKLGIDPERFEKTDIHIHVPEGAVPKDGPSAGVPLAIALISAFTNRRIRRDVSMTGEITLRGRVLPVGGIREKALAARRVGIQTFVMPKRNHTDLQKIPKKLRQGIKFVEITRLDEAIGTALWAQV
ncbi:MAG: endopeptidase La [Candidatus Promineifilaceae bacterium]